ncbi:MAG TPA: ankyrin repeat domain-containing protein [Oculatellaceae cyanobacterium]|jgi:ankyrin repeat protein
MQHLYSLIENNDIELLSNLLSTEKIDKSQFVDETIEQDEYGIVTPLEKAVLLRNFQVVEVLMNGIKVFLLNWQLFFRHNYITKALSRAIYLNDQQLIDLLWKDLLNEYRVEDLSNLVILDAVRGGHELLVSELLCRGADVNYLNAEESRTPLMVAAEANNVSLMQLLIAHGANPRFGFIEDSAWRSALTCCLWKDTIDALQYILTFYKDAPEEIKSIFAQAILIGDENIVVIQQLILAGFNVNERFEKGITPLILAAMNGHTQTIKFLVQAGANVNLLDEELRTSLLWAIYHNLEDIIDYLTPSTSPEIQKIIQHQLSDKLLLQNIFFMP